jgi:hypothetical protein
MTTHANRGLRLYPVPFVSKSNPFPLYTVRYEDAQSGARSERGVVRLRARLQRRRAVKGSQRSVLHMIERAQGIGRICCEKLKILAEGAQVGALACRCVWIVLVGVAA